MIKSHIPFTTFPVRSLDTNKLYPFVAQAMLEIGRYDGRLESIPNPNILLSPFSNKEAILSSRIEGTIASLTEVLEYDAGQKIENEKKQNDLHEIKNYREALIYGTEFVKDKKISLFLIRELHAILTKGVRGGDKTPGKFRTTQNFLGKMGDTLETARFIPPAPELLTVALDNFQNHLLDNKEIDTLILLAIIHAQFKILHPFNDGNGRLGRMLIPLFLYQRKILKAPSFYMSEYLEKNDAIYRDKLLAITDDNNWQSWCKFFLQGLIEQAKKNNKRVLSIMNLYELMKNKFVEITPFPICSILS